MKNCLLLLLLCLSLQNCNFKKITKITLQNNNSYPMAVLVKANNISHLVGPVAAGKLVESEMEWSAIDKKDGSFIIQLQDGNGNIIHSYEHGYFEQGELYNHVDMIVEGIEVKIKIQN